MYLRDRVVVLRREGFSRTSLRLSVWGRKSGLLAITARGIMRPGNNRIGDLVCEFDVAEVVCFVRPRSMSGILVDYAVVSTLHGRFGDVGERAVGMRPGSLAGWYAALSAVREAALLLWEGFPTEPADAPGVFRAFEGLLEMIGRARPFWAAVGGVMDMLRVSGLQPDLTACSSCAARIEGEVAFSPRRQGLICGDCLSRARAGKRPETGGIVLLDAGLVRFLGRLARLGLRDAEGLGRVSERRVRDVIRLLEAWFHATIGREPRSLKMLVAGSSRRTG